MTEVFRDIFMTTLEKWGDEEEGGLPGNRKQPVSLIQLLLI